jgi:menaquinone-dependent protoporphyrinogen oxidase
MPPRHFLIVYGTKFGQTGRIADRMADTLIADGNEVTIVHTHDRSLPGNHTFAEFDGVIVGASVISGKHQRAVARFVRANHARLSRLPSAFFSVSGAAGGTRPEDRPRATGYIADFLAQTSWQPGMTDAFGGAVAYTKYNPFVRWMMKRIAKSEGRPTDTSRDHELTDWAQVDRFVRTFAARIPTRTVAPPPLAA